MDRKKDGIRFRQRAVISASVMLVLLIASVILLFFRMKPGERMRARIIREGTVLETIALWEVTEEREIRIEAPDGGYNRIRILPASDGKPAAIGFVEADCPDKLCVHMGMISSDVLPVTCLPHRLVIEIKAE